MRCERTCRCPRRSHRGTCRKLCRRPVCSRRWAARSSCTCPPRRHRRRGACRARHRRSPRDDSSRRRALRRSCHRSPRRASCRTTRPKACPAFTSQVTLPLVASYVPARSHAPLPTLQTSPIVAAASPASAQALAAASPATGILQVVEVVEVLGFRAGSAPQNNRDVDQNSVTHRTVSAAIRMEPHRSPCSTRRASWGTGRSRCT